MNYSDHGPVVDVRCGYGIVIVFDDGTRVGLSPEADCCSESWLATNDPIPQEGEAVRTILQPLVGQVLDRIDINNENLVQPTEAVLDEMRTPQEYTYLCSVVTFSYGGGNSIVVNLFNSSNGYYTGWLEVITGVDGNRIKENYLAPLRELMNDAGMELLDSYSPVEQTEPRVVVDPVGPIGPVAPVGYYTGATGPTVAIGATGSTGWSGPTVRSVTYVSQGTQTEGTGRRRRQRRRRK